MRGSYQTRILLQLFVADGPDRDRQILADQLVYSSGQTFLVYGLSLQVKIDSTFGLSNRAPGRLCTNQRTHQMHAGMHTHKPMTPLPVEFEFGRRADMQSR